MNAVWGARQAYSAHFDSLATDSRSIQKEHNRERMCWKLRSGKVTVALVESDIVSAFRARASSTVVAKHMPLPTIPDSSRT